MVSFTRRNTAARSYLPVTFNFSIWYVVIAVVGAAGLFILLTSIYSIGPTQVGLIRKRFGAKLPGDNPLAFRGEAGYQAEMLMPGPPFQLSLAFSVTKPPLGQGPAR